MDSSAVFNRARNLSDDLDHRYSDDFDDDPSTGTHNQVPCNNWTGMDLWYWAFNLWDFRYFGGDNCQ